MRVLVSQICRYAVPGVAGSVLVVLCSMAGIMIASTYLAFPQAVFTGAYGGAAVALLACGGFYELGRRDGGGALDHSPTSEVVR